MPTYTIQYLGTENDRWDDPESPWSVEADGPSHAILLFNIDTDSQIGECNSEEAGRELYRVYDAIRDETRIYAADTFTTVFHDVTNEQA